MMKPNSLPAIDARYRPARHDSRTRSNRSFLPTGYLYQPQTDSLDGHTARQPGERARRAFHRMSTEMLARYQRDEPIESAFMAIVTAVAVWPLVDLLIVLAQTAN